VNEGLVAEGLVARVGAVLDRLGAAYALVGAGALAVHGVARSTFDVDLFTTEQAVLDPTAWAVFAGAPGASVDVRRGDAEDPLAGVVRIQAAGERDVDVVVGRLAWQAEIVTRALRVPLSGTSLPVVTAADLILLKLFAGGAQDAWDIGQLLGGPDRAVLVADVESRLHRLPPPAGRLWARITAGETA
jgi:hypothetical protein